LPAQYMSGPRRNDRPQERGRALPPEGRIARPGGSHCEGRGCPRAARS
jgi:hypothetical protein